MWVPHTPWVRACPHPGDSDNTSGHIATCWHQPWGLRALAPSLMGTASGSVLGIRSGPMSMFGYKSHCHIQLEQPLLTFLNSFYPTLWQAGTVHVQPKPIPEVLRGAVGAPTLLTFPALS